MNREEALQEALQLASQGWQLLPCDAPETGMLGYLAFRYLDRETREPVTDVKGRHIDEETRILHWPIFGQALVPDDAEVEAAELAAFASEGEVYLCDNPRDRTLGFVRYEPERGRAVVRRIRLTKLKGADESVKKAIMTTRDRLMVDQRGTSERRLAEAQALQAAGSP